MVFGFREDKLHFWHRNDPFGLTWAHREGIYQSIFYMHLTSQLCGTRLGMLVVNTAFQRMALLDDGVIAIERSSLNIPRSRFSDESYTIDQLDDDLDFWTSIPNTLLSPDGTATTTMTRSSTSTSTDTRSLKYLVPAQKRYIRFFQSIYHIAALTKIPTSTERRNSPLPRPLQCVRPGLAAADLAELLTFGGGSPTPVPLPRAESLLRGSGWSDSLLPRPESSDSFPTRLESASDISSPSRPKPGSNSLSASNAQAIPQETSPVTQATPIPDPYLSALPQTRWALLPNTSAESIAQASMRKHDYAGLRAKARAGGKREAEREDREGGRTRGRDDETDEEDDGTARDRGTSEGGEGAGVERNSGVGGDGGGREGGDGHREGSGEGEHDAKGGQGGSGEMGSGSGPGEDGARGGNSTRPNDAGDQAINHASITSLSPITPGADDRLHLFDSPTPRHDPLHRATMMPPHHARPQEAMTPPRHSVQHTTPTPPLTHPATPDPSFDTNTTDDSSTPTSLELYRDRLRLAGVRITMVVPEAMDRVVWRIATGRAVNSMSGRITGQEVVSGQPVVSKSGGFAGQPLGSKARQVQRVGKQMVV